MSRRPLSWPAQVGWVVHKDIALEARVRLRVATVPSFAALLLLIISFTVGAHGTVLTVLAPGALWLTVLLCSTLTMNASQRVDHDDDVLATLLAAGLAPGALFVGKALGNLMVLVLLGAIMGPIAYALFGLELPVHLPLSTTLWRLLAAVVAGVAAVSAPGTLLAAMAQGHRRALVVPLLYYPLVVPALLAAVRATAAGLAGDRGGAFAAWMSLLGAFNLLYWPLCTFLFAHVIDER